MRLKEALKTGAIVTGGFWLVAFVVAFVLLPALIAIAWYIDWVSFEMAAVSLLLIAIYTGGGGGSE